MNSIPAEQWAWMMRRRVPHLRVGIPSPPRQDRRAIDDQVTGANQPTPNGDLHCQDEQRLAYRSTGSLLRFHCWETDGIRGGPWASRGNPHASAKVGQLRNQSCISWYESRHSVRSNAISTSEASE